MATFAEIKDLMTTSPMSGSRTDDYCTAYLEIPEEGEIQFCIGQHVEVGDSFACPHQDDHLPHVIAAGQNYWGLGKTDEEAQQAFRENGGKTRQTYYLFRFGKDCHFEGIDGMGRIHTRGPGTYEREQVN